MKRLSTLVVLLLFVSACSGASSAMVARRTIEATGLGVAASYRVLKNAYEVESNRVIDELTQSGGTYEDYMQAMMPFSRAMDALDVVADLLEEGLRLVGVWETTSDIRREWRVWCRAAIATTTSLVNTIRLAGVPIPNELTAALTIVRELLGE